MSSASNLVPGDTNAAADVFLRAAPAETGGGDHTGVKVALLVQLGIFVVAVALGLIGGSRRRGHRPSTAEEDTP